MVRSNTIQLSAFAPIQQAPRVMAEFNNRRDKPISRASAPNLLVRDSGDTKGVPRTVTFGSESSKVTALRAPDPLPPSPADNDPGGWLEQPTDPTNIPDLGALAGSGHTDPGSLPGWAKGSRMQSASDEQAERGSDRQLSSHVSAQPVPSGVSLVVVGLLMAVCLAIGMIAGALLQHRTGPPTCPQPAIHGQH